MQRLTLLATLLLLMTTNACFAASRYCAATSQYIHTGMSAQQVLSICGKPQSVRKFKQTQYKKVPVIQWYYVLGSIRSGHGEFQLITGGRGNTLIVTLENDTVSSVSLAGQPMPVSTICKQTIKVGDSALDVSNACGEPDQKNQSFKQVLVSNQLAKMEKWLFQQDYAKGFTLTFRNGTLITID